MVKPGNQEKEPNLSNLEKLNNLNPVLAGMVKNFHKNLNKANVNKLAAMITKAFKKGFLEGESSKKCGGTKKDKILSGTGRVEKKRRKRPGAARRSEKKSDNNLGNLLSNLKKLGFNPNPK